MVGTGGIRTPSHGARGVSRAIATAAVLVQHRPGGGLCGPPALRRIGQLRYRQRRDRRYQAIPMKAMAILRRWRDLAVLLAMAAAPLPAAAQSTVGTEDQLPSRAFVTLRRTRSTCAPPRLRTIPSSRSVSAGGMPVEVVAESQDPGARSTLAGTVGSVPSACWSAAAGARDRRRAHPPARAAVSAAGVAPLQAGVIGRIKSCEAVGAGCKPTAMKAAKRDESLGGLSGEAVE